MSCMPREFLEREAYAKRDEKSEDRGDKVIDPDDIGEKVECRQIDCESTGARNHKACELSVLLDEPGEWFRHEYSKEQRVSS